MSKAVEGDTVKVHYTGTLQDGSVFDSSRERDPLEFKIGSGQLIKGFNDCVVGMAVGDSTKIDIPAAEAYGEHQEGLSMKIPRSEFPEKITPEIGLPLSMRSKDGGMMDMMITEISEDIVTVDGNHPLAGKDLSFDIELVEIAQ